MYFFRITFNLKMKDHNETGVDDKEHTHQSQNRQYKHGVLRERFDKTLGNMYRRGDGKKVSWEEHS